MAIKGDAALKMILAEDWFKSGNGAGDFDIILKNVAANNNLARVGRLHGLDQFVKLNPGTLDVSAKTMATTVEAILGAAQEDGGEMALRAVMGRLGLMASQS